MTRAACVLLSALLAFGALGQTVNWSQGVVYEYDGSGNVKKIGTDTYVYDTAQRLIRGTVAGSQQSYSYDSFGNRTACQPGGGGDCQYGFTINSSTNRIANRTYDKRGNLLQLPEGNTLDYDELGMVRKETGSNRAVYYIYTADDERIAVYDADTQLGTHTWRWTIRGLDKKPLREFSSEGTSGTVNFKWAKDHIWRDGTLLASRQLDATAPGGVSTYHYHTDHLGTPRQVTTSSAVIIGRHDYLPFGPELAGNASEPQQQNLKFTGHERDVARDHPPLDYMHARYYEGRLGRFLSVDPVLDVEVAQRRPQTWNRYSYVANNPINATDPSGAILISLSGQNTLLDIAGKAAANIAFRQDGSIDTAKLTQQDLTGNEGALLLQQMAVSTNIFSYDEGSTAQSKGGSQNVSGVLNLDDNSTDIIINGQPHAKGAGRFPITGFNGAVTVDPSVQYLDAATGTQQVPTRAIAFHELAESYAKVEHNMVRGPNNGPGAHLVARLREVILIMQRPSWTPYPAGGELKR